jgi:hypothetical protein
MFVGGTKRVFSRTSDRSALKMDPALRSEGENKMIMNNQMSGDQKTKFEAGMDESFAKRLKLKLLKKDMFTAEIVPKQILLVDQQGNRYERDSKNSSLKHEYKEKFHTVDMCLLSHDYDLRIGCATETTSPHVPANPIWTMERHKYRTSFSLTKEILKSEASKWQVDYTEVHLFESSNTNSNNNNSTAAASVSSEERHEYELEIELKKEPLRKWIQLITSSSASPEAVEKYTKEIINEFLFLLDYIIPSSMDTSDELELTACTGPLKDSESEKRIVFLNNHLRNNSGNASGNLEFLGSMPVNLWRSSLNTVLQSEYYLTEKTDGIRYLCYVLDNPANPSSNLMVFMDRSKTLFKFPHSEFYGNLFPRNTIFDGEIVFNHLEKRSVFLIFDVLCYNSIPCFQDLFCFRYEKIEKEILPNYFLKYQEMKAKNLIPTGMEKKHSLLVYYKRFLLKENIFELMKNFDFEKGERIYKEKASSSSSAASLDRERSIHSYRYHKSDGIIFQPNTPYKFGKYYDLLKWKWSDLRSIDLKVVVNPAISALHHPLWRVTNKEIYFYCIGPENTLIDISKRGDYNVSLDKFDTARLLSEMEDMILINGPAKLQGMIAEVIYDVSVGKWIYSKIRKDKNDPNYIDAVLGVFIEQAEAISIEELEFTFLAAMKKLEMDFDVHVNKLKANVVNWQRERVQKMN